MAVDIGRRCDSTTPTQKHLATVEIQPPHFRVHVWAPHPFFIQILLVTCETLNAMIHSTANHEARENPKVDDTMADARDGPKCRHSQHTFHPSAAQSFFGANIYTLQIDEKYGAKGLFACAVRNNVCKRERLLMLALRLLGWHFYHV